MIVVTGASGLVGLHLLRELSQTHLPIRALYHIREPQYLEGTDASYIETHAIDIGDFQQVEDAFAGATQVYHTAAIVSYDPRDRDRMTRINVEGTANVVNAARHLNIQKMVHISSIATLGDESYPTLIHEKSTKEEDKERSFYAKTKSLAELEVWRGIAEGLEAVILNPSIILGEGDWHRSSTNLFKVVYDEFPYFTQGISGWVGATDVAKAAILAMNSSVQGERFILNQGNYPYREVFTWMANAMNKKAPFKEAKPWMTELLWRIQYLKSVLTGKQATISKETARSAQEKKGYSADKWLSAFPGFSFRPISEVIQHCGKGFIINS
jgi:dihydroflavonol-4-reductase